MERVYSQRKRKVREETSKEKVKKKKDKWESKQYIVPKSKIKSRAHYAPEHERDCMRCVNV